MRAGRGRAALEAAPGGEFRLGLMESLPWPDASFDVVTSFNAVQYALDPELALIEAARVVRADGRIADLQVGPCRPRTSSSSFSLSIGANGVHGDLSRRSDPVEDAIRATRLEVLATGDVPAPIEIADDAALCDLAVARWGRERIPASRRRRRP